VEVGDLTVEHFAGREGQRFWITFSDAELDLELASVTRPPEHWGTTDKREPFTVTFHATLDHVLPARIWPVEHEELGTMEFFLVPIGPSDAGDAMRYEAVFN
jgi:hypothetical protein